MGDFVMPSLGADMEEGTFVEWLVQEGDAVRRGDVVAVVETPKAAVEIECFEDGTVLELVADEGDVVPVGGVLARIGSGAPADATPAPEPRPLGHTVSSPLARRRARAQASQPRSDEATPKTSPPQTPTPENPTPENPTPETPTPQTPTPDGPQRVAGDEVAGRVRASPYARRLAAEAGLDLHGIPGTGLDDTVRAQDVRSAAAAPHQPAPPGGAEEAPTPGGVPGPDTMRQSIAALMTVANREIPHYYLSTTVDLSAATAWVRRRNRELPVTERLVPSALLLLAAARAAHAVPDLNGHWVHGAFDPADTVDLGLIVSLRRGGIIVPAIRDAHRLSVEETMAALREVTARARAGRLRGSDLGQPSISVSNLGDQGVESVLGVVYPPQVALVGFGAVTERPWAVEGMLGVRPLVTVTLAADHRASDGAVGARFLKHLTRLLERPEEL